MVGKRKQALRAAVAAVALGGVARAGSAATIAWDNGGADNNWNTAANWAGDMLPTSGDKVQLTSSIAANATVSLGASQTINELRIESFAGVNNFTISTWINVNAFATWQRIFDFGSGTNNYMFLTTQYTGTAPNAAKLRFTIRTPSFAHMQMLPLLARGRMIPDLLAILGAMDFVLADVDR